MSQGITLCGACHKKVHDEGWRIARVPDGAQVELHPDANALLKDAGKRTLAIVHRMDKCRPAFRFERTGVTTEINDQPVGW